VVDRSSSKTASPAPFLVNGKCTSGSCTKTPFGRQGDSTGEFRDQNRSSIRSFFRRSGLRLGERDSEREIQLIPASPLTYSWKEADGKRY
jgi:hypothetical protein